MFNSPSSTASPLPFTTVGWFSVTEKYEGGCSMKEQSGISIMHEIEETRDEPIMSADVKKC